jgi:uncharacterized protein YecE (DUF72 family)
MNIGTAAWTIPTVEAKSFPVSGSHLERYSQIFNAVEINSSFYKDHLIKTYAKWAALTPFDFKFSVKLNQRFTHKSDLIVSAIDLLSNLETIAYLEDKWKVLLVQLPASQKFYPERMEKIYKTIRSHFQGMIALEARNLTWMSPEAIELMKEFAIAKVNADPERCPGEVSVPGHYYRMHGTPEIYRSSYSDSFLADLYTQLASKDTEAWCIFDNTTFGYATTNALALKKMAEQKIEEKNESYNDLDLSLQPFDH